MKRVNFEVCVRPYDVVFRVIRDECSFDPLKNETDRRILTMTWHSNVQAFVRNELHETLFEEQS